MWKAQTQCLKRLALWHCHTACHWSSHLPKISDLEISVIQWISKALTNITKSNQLTKADTKWPKDASQLAMVCKWDCMVNKWQIQLSWLRYMTVTVWACMAFCSYFSQMNQSYAEELHKGITSPFHQHPAARWLKGGSTRVKGKAKWKPVWPRHLEGCCWRTNYIVWCFASPSEHWPCVLLWEGHADEPSPVAQLSVQWKQGKDVLHSEDLACIENLIFWERVTRRWWSRGRWWSLGNRRQHGGNDNRQQHWVDRRSSWDGSHSCSMLLGKTTTQLDTMFAADVTGIVISDLSLASCSYGAFDACRGTGYGYQWAAEDREYREHGGSSWRLRAMVNKIAWPPLIVDRVTLDTNQFQGKKVHTIANGTPLFQFLTNLQGLKGTIWKQFVHWTVGLTGLESWETTMDDMMWFVYDGSWS